MKKNSLAFIAFAAAMLVGQFACAECNTCVYRDDRGRCVSENCAGDALSMTDNVTWKDDLIKSDDATLVDGWDKTSCVVNSVAHCTKMNSSCVCTACDIGYTLSNGACNATNSGSSTTTTTTTKTPTVTSCPDGTKKSADGCCCIPV